MLNLITEIKFAGRQKHYDNRSFFVSLDDQRQMIGFFEAHLQPHVAKFASRFISNYLQSNLNHKCDQSKIQQVLELAFQKCQIHMIAHRDAIEKFKKSGTCAIVIVRCGKSAWIASLGNSKCFLIDSSDRQQSKCVSPTDELTVLEEKKRILNCHGWYENGLLFNKIAVTRALGDLWQIGTLSWEAHTNMKFLDLKALRDTNSDFDTVSEVMRTKQPKFCIDWKPHIHFEQDLTIFDQVLVCSNTFINAIHHGFAVNNRHKTNIIQAESILKTVETKMNIKLENLASLDSNKSVAVHDDEQLERLPVLRKCANMTVLLLDVVKQATS